MLVFWYCPETKISFLNLRRRMSGSYTGYHHKLTLDAETLIPVKFNHITHSPVSLFLLTTV